MIASNLEYAEATTILPFVECCIFNHCANKGTDTRTLQAYLGHRSIQSTVRYTELAPGRFKNLWRD